MSVRGEERSRKRYAVRDDETNHLGTGSDMDIKSSFAIFVRGRVSIITILRGTEKLFRFCLQKSSTFSFTSSSGIDLSLSEMQSFTSGFAFSS